MRAALWAIGVGGVFGLAGCSGPAPPVEMEDLVASLELDLPVDLDVACPAVPADAERVMFAAVFVNDPPIRPGSDEFPTDFCPANAGFFAHANGRGNSSILGAFVWSERYCTVPPGNLIAEGSFTWTDGDRIDWDAAVQLDSIPPPIPFATFSGELTFTGGTGRFADASGEAVLVAEQLGDAPPGRPAGSTATAVCGWLTGLE